MYDPREPDDGAPDPGVVVISTAPSFLVLPDSSPSKRNGNLLMVDRRCTLLEGRDKGIDGDKGTDGERKKSFVFKVCERENKEGNELKLNPMKGVKNGDSEIRVFRIIV